MRGLTLHQPGASAIAYGAKRFETRSWAPPRELVGQRLAIHAARTKPSGRDLRETLGWLSTNATHREWLLQAGCVSFRLSEGSCADHRLLRTLVLHPHLLPRGAIVATAVIGRVFDAEKVGVSSAEEMVGDFSLGRYAWRLEDVRRLEPVKFTGGQGLFRVPDGAM